MAMFEPRLGPGPGVVSTGELSERLDDPSLVVVDVRSMAAYNGWRLHDEARGGHIPGSAAFPRAWFSSFADAEVGRLLGEKGVTADRTIVVYGDGADDAADVVPRLTRLGYEDVWIYEAGFSAWAADGSRRVGSTNRRRQTTSGSRSSPRKGGSSSRATAGYSTTAPRSLRSKRTPPRWSRSLEPMQEALGFSSRSS
jgi:3-mercaptopyruvate sulfurtransferase SseA